MSSGTSGFHNAPVTRTLAFGTAALTVLLGIQGRTSTSGLSYQDIFKKLHLWKLIASVFGFSSTPELAFGLYLLYYFRVFERQIGSNKYSVFVLFSVVVSSLLEVLALTFLKDPTLNVLASGPFGVIFSSFVPFYFDIPVSSRFRIFGIQFTDKSFIYLAGLQLLLSSWKRSLLPGVCGVIAGSLYRLNVFGIRRIKFPEPISSFFSRLTLPSLGGASHSSSTGNIVGSVPSYQGHQMEVNHPSSAPNASMPEPQEDSVATLVSMGFDRPSARQALVHAGNDISVATNILLEAQSH
uniref:Ubiquitin-associated domain-containing protein 2 n=1 Tax=Anthurium amnicola TaxID=1678845 RepID=A0A1D1ZIZ4_9ARAE